MASKRLSVLFLCTGNACRSQMAEGWARHLHRTLLDAASAGIEPQGLDPRAVQVMAEAGVDISGHSSKHLAQAAQGKELDYVITVCGHAQEHCPHYPGSHRILHQGFVDPARAQGQEEEVLDVFRQVRDEIRTYVEGLPALLEADRFCGKETQG